MGKIVIYGTGSIARLAHYYFEADSEHEVVAFTTGKTDRSTDLATGLPIVALDRVATSFPPARYAMFIAGGDLVRADARIRAWELALEVGYELVSYISSKATVWPGTPIGHNSFVLERAVIQPWVTLGVDVTVWSGCHIGHETLVGDHSFLAARAVVSGNVVIEPFCYLGPNSAVRNSITLAQGTRIGAGVTLRKTTTPKTVYVATASERMLG